jgi:hypothetical protein
LACAVFGCAAAAGDEPARLEISAAAATTTAFQDGVAPTAAYAGTRDTMIEEDHASTSHGSDKKLSVSGDTPSDSGDDEVALVRWELGAAIPAGALVTGATVILSVSDKADQSYALFEALAAWDVVARLGQQRRRWRGRSRHRGGRHDPRREHRHVPDRAHAGRRRDGAALGERSGAQSRHPDRQWRQ